MMDNKNLYLEFIIKICGYWGVGIGITVGVLFCFQAYEALLRQNIFWGLVAAFASTVSFTTSYILANYNHLLFPLHIK